MNDLDRREIVDFLITELKDQWTEYREGGKIELCFYQVATNPLAEDPGPFKNSFQVWIGDQLFEGETLAEACEKAKEATT